MRLIVIYLLFTLLLFGSLNGCSSREANTRELQDEVSVLPSSSQEAGTPEQTTDNVAAGHIINGVSKDWNSAQQRIGNDDWLDVNFIDSAVGWMVSVKGDTLVPLGGSLFKTIDGGKSWKQIPLKLSKDSFISNVNFISRTRGWIVVQTVGSKSAKFEIMESTNGGATWTPSFSLDAAIASKMLINDRGNGWIIGIKGTATYQHDRQNLVLYTDNFGSSWKDVTPNAVLAVKGETSPSVLFEDIFTDLSFDRDSRTVALSRDGKLVIPTENGSTWTLQRTLDSREKHSQGFSKLVSLKDGKFIALSGANVPEGVWSVLTVIHDKVTQKSSMEDMFITDLNSISPNGAVASGLRVNWGKSDTLGATSAVVLTTSDFGTWQLLSDVSGGCRLGCRFNKIARRGNGYFVVGSDGIVVKIDRKPLLGQKRLSE